MSLVPLTKKSEIQKAFNGARGKLVKGCQSFTRILGFKGGYATAEVFWHPARGMWMHYDDQHIPNRHWCCYGVTNPKSAQQLDITVEINPPRSGYDRRIHGAFLQDGRSRVYLAHSGRVGGGRPGIGKSAFLEFSRGLQREQVLWPDGHTSEMFIVGRLSASRFPQQVASYVYEVSRFKDAVTGAGAPLPAPTPAGSFSPEFEGEVEYLTSSEKYHAVATTVRSSMPLLMSWRSSASR